MKAWRSAVTWGISIAILHRLLLGLWMGLAWVSVRDYEAFAEAGVDSHNTEAANLPELKTELEELVFGVWRRWDAIFYLDLALHGYRTENVQPTVFGVMTPLGIAAIDFVMPGSVDLGAMIYGTLTFAFAMTMLYRVCQTYYEDENVALWTMAIYGVLPIAFFLSAPMSDAIYLGSALTVFYAGTQKHWWLVGIAGMTATLARSQGIVLFPTALLLLITEGQSWTEQRKILLRHGGKLLLVPFGFILFVFYRSSQDLPPLNEVYEAEFYWFATDPLRALYHNLHWFFEKPLWALVQIDLLFLFINFGLAAWMLRYATHRRLPLLAYTGGHLLLFLSKVNYFWETNDVMYSQSMARYSLALFPIWILLGTILRRSSKAVRMGVFILFALGLLIFSAMHGIAGYVV